MDLDGGVRKMMRNISKYKGEDRISALPDELIHHILKFLPDTKSAVETSVLSKRWKLIWTTLPFLVFEWDQQGSSKNITNLTRHVLKHRNHQSSISCLKLAYLPPGLTDKFVEYAVSHQVQDLNVFVRDITKAFKLSKFSSDSINKLVLRMKLEDIVEDSDCWVLPALSNLHLSLLPAGDGNRVLPARCLTCLPALRTLSLSFWNFAEPPLYLSLPELTSLRLSNCKMPKKIWDLPALKTLTLDLVRFVGNMNDVFPALVNLENLTLHGMSLVDCYIRCPQLVNLEIRTPFFYTATRYIVVLAPKLMKFTAVGIFPIIFEDSKLDNVHVKLRGWINRTSISKETLNQYYQLFMTMFPRLGSAKILNLDLETIKALSSMSDSLVSSPPPFYNLKYVKLPYGFKEASLSSVLRSYLLGGSPTATIVDTSHRNIVPHTAAASVTAQNVGAPINLADTEDIQKSVDTADLGVQDSEVHADRVTHGGASFEGTCSNQVSSLRGNTDSGLRQGDEINSEFVCLLEQIMKRYPETSEHFTTKNKKFRTMKLNMLCTAVNDFTKIPMTEVNAEMIVEYMDLFADLKKLGFNVSWLVNRLNYVEHLRFPQALPTKPNASDCHNDKAKSELQGLQICIDDAKIKLQDLQTLRSEKMQEIEKAHGIMETNLAVGCVKDDLLSGP